MNQSIKQRDPEHKKLSAVTIEHSETSNVIPGTEGADLSAIQEQESYSAGYYPPISSPVVVQPEPEAEVEIVTATTEAARVKRYKSPVRLELQKFGISDQKLRQLGLAEIFNTQDQEGGETTVTGLDLSVMEDRVLSALQILLAKTGYQGNIPGTKVTLSDTDETYKWAGLIPRLAITPAELLEACEIEKTAKGQYPPERRKEVIKALRALAEVKRLVLKKVRYSQGKKLYDVLVVKRPLIYLIEGFEGLTEAEAEQVERGNPPTDRISKLIIELGPLFMDGIENFYLLKPETFFREIVERLEQKRGKRVTNTPKSIPHFLEWLMTKNQPSVTVYRDTLITTLRMESYRRQRKLKQAYQQIDQCLELAQELGYLLAYEEDSLGSIRLTLNPVRCSRVHQPDPDDIE